MGFCVSYVNCQIITALLMTVFIPYSSLSYYAQNGFSTHMTQRLVIYYVTLGGFVCTRFNRALCNFSHLAKSRFVVSQVWRLSHVGLTRGRLLGNCFSLILVKKPLISLPFVSLLSSCHL